SLFPLFTTAAIAGYWAALRTNKLPLFLALAKMQRTVAPLVPIKQTSVMALARLTPGVFHTRLETLVAWLPVLLVAASIPAAAAIYVVRASPTAPNFEVPFPNEPELLDYLGKAIGLRLGGEFRGSLTFETGLGGETMFNLWIQGIPTVNEY